MDAPVTATYEDPRAHAVRERYLMTFGGRKESTVLDCDEGVSGDLAEERR